MMVPLGIDVSCTTQTISWDELTVPWKPSTYFSAHILQDEMAFGAHAYYIQDPLSEWIDDRTEHISYCYSTQSQKTGKLKESRYEVIPTSEITIKQNHLTQSQRDELFQILDKFKPLFNGNLVKNNHLGAYKGQKVHLYLKKDAKPHSQRSYPVPYKHKKIFK